MNNFQFFKNTLNLDKNKSKVLISDIKSFNELYDNYNQALKFPYFGRNLDALYDLLSEIYWIKIKPVYIIHYNLPNFNEIDLKKYLSVLLNTLEVSNNTKDELLIYFSEKDRKKINKLMTEK